MSKTFKSVNEALDFAIQGEIEAAEFYIALAAKMKRASDEKGVRGVAAEERGHRTKLEAVKRASTRSGPGPNRLMGLGLPTIS